MPASWLSPGRASYSPMMAMTGPPSPHSPIMAVGIPATPSVTAKPCSPQHGDMFGRRPMLAEVQLRRVEDAIGQAREGIALGIDQAPDLFGVLHARSFVRWRDAESRRRSPKRTRLRRASIPARLPLCTHDPGRRHAGLHEKGSRMKSASSVSAAWEAPWRPISSRPATTLRCGTARPRPPGHRGGDRGRDACRGLLGRRRAHHAGRRRRGARR